MEEVLFYKIFDIFCTTNESFILLLFMVTVTDKDVLSIKNLIVAICYVIVTIIGTYTIPIMALKTVVLIVIGGCIWSFVKKCNLLKGLTLFGLAMGWMCTIQATVIYILSFWNENPSFDMGEFYIGSWQYTLAIQVIGSVLTVLLYKVFCSFYFRWEIRDLILVGIMGYTETAISGNFTEKLLKSGVQERGNLFFSMCLFWITFFLIIHFQRTSELRTKEEKERLRIHDLEQQTAFYQSKSDEEQKTRRLYHDMKNLMLAASLSQNNSSLLNTVSQELEEYGQYYDSGNGILNVILKEKQRKAKELNIDMLLDVDFSEGSFLEDRDVVIIFGNALDNAIEASEKLPMEERLITVKSCKIRKMLIIIFENNTKEYVDPELKTTKEDAFLHGFGIKNIKEAVEQYDGTCTIETVRGSFLLKITIPLME